MCSLDVDRQRRSNLMYRQRKTNLEDTNLSGFQHPDTKKELASNFLGHQSIELGKIGNLNDNNFYPEQYSKSNFMAYPR